MKKYSVFALYLFFGEALVRICGFYANAYLGHILGPPGYGLIIISTSFLTYSLLISDSGLRILGIVETSKPVSEQKFSFADIVNGKIIQAALSFLLLYVLTIVLYKDEAVRTICILFLLNIFYDALFLEWYFKGLQRFKAIAFARVCASILYVISLTFYVKTADDVNKVALIFFATNLVSVVILFSILPATPSAYTFSFSIKKYFSLMKHSLPLGIGTLLNQVTVYLPPIVLGKYADFSESGYLGAALKIVLLIMIIDKTFSTIFLSSLPRLWSSNREDTKKNLQTLLHLTMAVGFLVSLTLSITSQTAITLVFGNTYSNSTPVLSIISWFFALTMINSIFVYGLIAIDQKILYLKATAIGFTINAILIIVCIYRFGIFGAGTAIVCGELIFIILCHQAFKKYSSLTFYVPFIKTVTASAAAYYIAVNLKFHMAVQSFTAAILFAALVLVFQIITKNDITVLLTKWNKS